MSKILAVIYYSQEILRVQWKGKPSKELKRKVYEDLQLKYRLYMLSDDARCVHVQGLDRRKEYHDTKVCRACYYADLLKKQEGG